MDKLILKDDLKKYYGIHPHNCLSNVCIGDTLFRNQIEAKYQKSISDLIEIIGGIKELNKD